MAGLVVSTTRLILHTPRYHREVGVGESLELQHASGVHKGSISIKTATWEIRHFTVDRDGLMRLRRAVFRGEVPRGLPLIARAGLKLPRRRGAAVTGLAARRSRPCRT